MNLYSRPPIDCMQQDIEIPLGISMSFNEVSAFMVASVNYKVMRLYFCLMSIAGVIFVIIYVRCEKY